MARVAAEARKDPERVGPVLQVLVGDEPDTPGRLRPVVARLGEAHGSSPS